jgi:hypothetical protein
LHPARAFAYGWGGRQARAKALFSGWPLFVGLKPHAPT